VFEDTFRGGLTLAVGDALARGYSQILVGAGFTGGPRLTLFDVSRNAPVLNYFAFDSSLRGGVSADMAQLFGAAGGFQIVAAPGKGGGPVVRMYDAATGALLGQKFATEETDNREGVQLELGNNTTDGARRLVVAIVSDTTGQIAKVAIDPNDLRPGTSS
jgi:hypothetical protein